MKTTVLPNQMIWFDEHQLPNVTFEFFTPEFWQRQNRVIGSAQGRGTTWFIELENAQKETLQGALRHYRRGGLFGKIVQDGYFFTGWEQTRSYQEYHLLQHLIDSGVNVPKPYAARAVKNGLSYRADLLSEKIANARDLVAILEQAPLSPEVYSSIGQQIAKMHAALVNHTDLNIHNILLDDQNKVWIIDFDKCRIEPETNDKWQENNLQRLLRSFRKERNKKEIKWQPEDFRFVLEGYRTARRSLN